MMGAHERMMQAALEIASCVDVDDRMHAGIAPGDRSERADAMRAGQLQEALARYRAAYAALDVELREVASAGATWGSVR